MCGRCGFGSMSPALQREVLAKKVDKKVPNPTARKKRDRHGNKKRS